MLRNIAYHITTPTLDGARILAELHPAQLTSLLESAWRQQYHDTSRTVGHPDLRVKNLNSPLDLYAIQTPTVPALPSNMRWDHLIYAYMIENTRIVDIFRRVLHEFIHGEKLGYPSDETQLWLRNTEELFFKDASPFSIATITGNVRPDHGATRRNAYMRLLGMDLNHGTTDDKPYLYVKPHAANTLFLDLFDAFLHEVWIGMMHYKATAAPDPTDKAKILNLIQHMNNLLLSRRETGNLSREEFAIVSMMSWFHMTVEWNGPTLGPLPIITDLQATVEGPEQRLFKIAERVGIPAHGYSRCFFDIADAISVILTQIEYGSYKSTDDVMYLYTPGPAPGLTLPTFPPNYPQTPEAAMRIIIDNWSLIRKPDAKAYKIK